MSIITNTLTNCGSNNPPNMELLNDFFKEKLNMLYEHEIEPSKVDSVE